MLQVKVLHRNAIIPKKSHKEDAGWDLFAIENGRVNSHQQSCISLGIAITVPKGTYGRIAPRSGLSNKFCIDIMAGVIDRQYKHEIKVILRNHGTRDYKYIKGDRIAQLIITEIRQCKLKVVDELDTTIEDRGGGFGSSGI